MYKTKKRRPARVWRRYLMESCCTVRVQWDDGKRRGERRTGGDEEESESINRRTHRMDIEWKARGEKKEKEKRVTK